MVDDNGVNFNTGEGADGSFLQIRLDQNSDPTIESFGPWMRLEGVLNPYEHAKDTKFFQYCQFDPTDDFFDPSGGGVQNETMCPGQRMYSDAGEFTGTDAAACGDSNSNNHTDCGQPTPTITGPGFTSQGSIGTGVWVKTGYDLAGFLGRRAQVRCTFSSWPFGDTASLSYNETPSNPGGWDRNEFDDGWQIDNILFTGLLNRQLNLVIDGGDDKFESLGGERIECGDNLIAETKAEGNDVQLIAIGATCTAATDDVVGPGDAVIDSIASEECPSSVEDWCPAAGGANARLNDTDNTPVTGDTAAQRTFATLDLGSPFGLSGAASFLSSCVNGGIQYQFVECNTQVLGAPCNAPANGTVKQAFSSDPAISVYPQSDTRYSVEVRCSSQGTATAPCIDDSDVLVRVYPADEGGAIDIGGSTVTCNTADTGSATRCDAGDSLSISFRKPGQSGNLSGFDLVRKNLLVNPPPAFPPPSTIVPGFGSPIITGGICLGPAQTNFGIADATDALVTVSTAGSVFTPASKQVGYYIVVHSQTVNVQPGPADRARPIKTGTGINGPSPATARFVDPFCP
jgi:hypothetical protein